jgi:IclR family transcriptional regulator, pca regulon regulatory protein
MSPEDDSAFDRRYVVPGLARGLALLQQFSRAKPQQKVSELAASLGLSRSATFRLVYTLEREGFLRRDQSGHLYGVTSKVLSLGFEYMFAEPLTEAAQDTLRELSNDTKAGAHLVMLDDWHCVYFARVVPPILLIANLEIGTRLPAHLTASGRILLAYRNDAELRRIYKLLVRECTDQPLPRKVDDLLQTAAEDRERGYVHSRSRFDPSVSSIAYPILDRAGEIVAAINVVGSDAIFKDDLHVERLRMLVAKAAAKLSERLGHIAISKTSADG